MKHISRFDRSICFRWSNKYEFVKQQNKQATVNVFMCHTKSHQNASSVIEINCPVLSKIIDLKVSLLEMVGKIKQAIEMLEGIPRALQVLYFQDVVLQDTYYLAECGITNGSSLLLSLKLHTAICKFCCTKWKYISSRPVKIYVACLDGRKLELKMPLCNLVSDLKQLIHEKYGILAEEQLLFFRKKKLEDDCSLLDCGLQKKSTLMLLVFEYDNCQLCLGCANAFEMPTITILFAENSVIWAFYPQMSTKMFKNLTYEYLRHVHPDLQKIVYKNEELQDEHTLRSYGISNGDSVSVMLRFDKRKCDKCRKLLLKSKKK